MSLQVKPVPSVPEESARVAHAAFPKGNPYLTLRDELEPISIMPGKSLLDQLASTA